MSRTFMPAALLAAALFAAPAFAQPSPIQIEHAWSRAALAGHTGVVFLTITDTGAPDRLVSIASPVAAKAELHESFVDQGVTKMRPVAALAVAPGKPATLKPGGYHIMLVELKQALKEGDTVPLTLTFEKAGPVSVTATVEKAGASAMPMTDHGQMGGMPMDNMHH
jgi:periplasmic copper chaperone A